MGKMNLTEAEREELLLMQRSRTMAVGQVRRARLILLLDEGASRGAIMNELRCDSRFIATWQTHFADERLVGLYGRHPGRAPRRDLARLEARVLDYMLRRKPADGSTHWSSRKLAAQLGVPFMTDGSTCLAQARHSAASSLDTHMVSNDPEPIPKGWTQP
ncbi:putative transposase [Candidatus Burkholderia pumila]|uniref:Transposase n=1 Tax=Candidatus Burkholderia pumila TaxID=1090375 RepID=A0ABR5HM23_9BURK|nr:putative transposase [Candidatus Burkholderia pumila]